MRRCERVGGPIKLIADGLLTPSDGYDYLRAMGKKIEFIAPNRRVRRAHRGVADPSAPPHHLPHTSLLAYRSPQARAMLLSSCDGSFHNSCSSHLPNK